jgi:hypothetical protein
MEYIAFDAHTHYILASVARPDGRLVRERRLAHERGVLQPFLAHGEPGSPVALETVGNWYWIVDEIERAGCLPKLVHARKAKQTGTVSRAPGGRRFVYGGEARLRHELPEARVLIATSPGVPIMPH